MNDLPRQKLCEIINIYGSEVCNDSRRVRGLLHDLCCGNYPEINFLITALEEQVKTELTLSLRNVSYEMLLAHLKKRLYTNRGMAEEIAHWTIDSWALALGVISTATYTPQQAERAMSINQPRSSPTPVEKSHSDTVAQRTIIVSPSGGQFTTISAAIRSAVPKTRIIVYPGHYYEGFIIDKQLEIIGNGSREHIIIEGRDTSCIMMQADYAIVQGLTLRCRSTGINQEIHAVDIAEGRLRLIGCDITSNTGACIAVHGHSAYSEIQTCWLHDAGRSGLFIENYAQGVIENCHIFGNAFPGISIRRNANLAIRNCKVYRGRNHGILVWENGYAAIEDCDIYDNAYAGVKAKDERRPTVKRCHIYNNSQQDEWVYQNGLGNTRYPSAPQTYSVHNRERIPEVRSTPIPTSIEYASEKVVYQTEKRQSLLDLFLHPFRSLTKRNKA